MAVCVGIQSLVAIDVTRFFNCQPLRRCPSPAPLTRRDAHKHNC